MQAIFLGLFWVLFFLFSLFCVLELCLCVCYCGSLSSNAEMMFEVLVYISHAHIFIYFLLLWSEFKREHNSKYEWQPHWQHLLSKEGQLALLLTPGGILELAQVSNEQHWCFRVHRGPCKKRVTTQREGTCPVLLVGCCGQAEEASAGPYVLRKPRGGVWRQLQVQLR